jgi:drug/metabolite transporter (DMT)-like permease
LSWAGTSGLGYALWYAVLPRLEAAQAAIAQLAVPLIALAGGVVFLGEGLSVAFAVASVLILGGVVISMRHKG